MAGCLIQSVFGVLCTYFVCGNYWLLYLTYGVAFGAGIGISYPNILCLVMEWYPNHKGLVNGIVLCGFGISALMFDKIQTVLINPDNVQQDVLSGFSDNADIIEDFPNIFLYLGAIFVAMQVIGVLLMRVPPNFPNIFLYLGAIFVAMQVIGVLLMRVPPTSAWPLAPSSNSPEHYDEELPLIAIPSSEHELWNMHDQTVQQENEQEHEQHGEGGYDVIEVLKDVRFWQLYLNFFVDGMIIVFVATQWKMYSNKLGITDDAYLSLIGSVSAIFNGFGRVLFGWVLDQTQSFRFTLGLINILLAALLFSWPYCFGTVTPFIWVCLLFGLFSSNFSIFPTIVSFVFGAKNAGINVGMIFTSQIFSAFVAIYVLDEVDRLMSNWHYMCYLIGAIQVFGSFVSFAFKSNKRPSYFNDAFLNQQK
eukprot:CAMPEP_0197076504 /NCGR_PEP_ID=MMETSP1384-20130603/212150_1 /TAXON_ID=29189 /ORGANISM="Ammonia sp." /LENGTH=419 /DNA_ID=CAMNT_0042515361 /DNA_START=315 /DNA_END=1574 /DNA_ORIENTATION=+